MGMWIAGIYVVIMAVIDRKNREIPIVPGMVCFAFIVVAQIVQQKEWECWIPGMLVGIFMYLVSYFSKGGIGSGDALVYFVTGVALGFVRNMELFMLSLVLSAVIGLFLLVFRHVGRKYEMPFIPFTAVAYGVVMLL